MTRPLIIAAFDVSKLRIGAAGIDYDTSRVLTASVHMIHAGNDLESRHTAFTTIADTLDQIGTVTICIVEDSFMGPMRRTGALHSAYAIGNVEAFCAARWPGILVDRIKPTVWRKTLGLEAKGKDDPLFYAREHTLTDTGKNLDEIIGTQHRGKLKGEQDAADAICLAKAAHQLINHPLGEAA